MDQEIWHEPHSVRDAAVAWGLVSEGLACLRQAKRVKAVLQKGIDSAPSLPEILDTVTKI